MKSCRELPTLGAAWGLAFVQARRRTGSLAKCSPLALGGILK